MKNSQFTISIPITTDIDSIPNLQFYFKFILIRSMFTELFYFLAKHYISINVILFSSLLLPKASCGLQVILYYLSEFLSIYITALVCHIFCSVYYHYILNLPLIWN